MGASETEFGKYKLLRRIASGGMGEVHLAKLTGPSGFEKLVVIKRLLRSRQGEQKYIDMFFSEARVAAQLGHSNIVQVYEVGTTDGVPYIAMEYVHGKSLRKVMDTAHKRPTTLGKEGLPVGFVAQIVAQLCHGLAFAHDARHLSGATIGLVHRDINPHNVLVSYQGEVKIIDFGIAKSELNSEKTQAGTIKGTVVYMSPEQSLGERLDKRSDLFSVGICLYEALTGKNPFHKSGMGASLEAIRRAEVPPIPAEARALQPFVPLLVRALARHRDERFDDCAELAERLVQLLERGEVPRPPISLTAYMAELFGQEMLEEERLLERTDMVRNPLLASGAHPGTRPSVARPPAPAIGLDTEALALAGLAELGVASGQTQVESEAQAEPTVASGSVRAPVPGGLGQADPPVERTVAQLPPEAEERTQLSASALSSSPELQAAVAEAGPAPSTDGTGPKAAASASAAPRPLPVEATQSETPSPISALLRPLRPYGARARIQAGRAWAQGMAALSRHAPGLHARLLRAHAWAHHHPLRRALPYVASTGMVMAVLGAIAIVTQPPKLPRLPALPELPTAINAPAAPPPTAATPPAGRAGGPSAAPAHAAAGTPDPAEAQNAEDSDAAALDHASEGPADPAAPSTSVMGGAAASGTAAPAPRRPRRERSRGRRTEAAARTMLHITADPPLAVQVDGAFTSAHTVNLRSTQGTLQLGQNPEADPFIIKVDYRVTAQGISVAIESTPWANISGAGGIALGRTPLGFSEPSNLWSFELKNPHVSTTQRISLRLATGDTDG